MGSGGVRRCPSITSWTGVRQDRLAVFEVFALTQEFDHGLVHVRQAYTACEHLDSPARGGSVGGDEEIKAKGWSR